MPSGLYQIFTRTHEKNDPFICAIADRGLILNPLGIDRQVLGQVKRGRK